MSWRRRGTAEHQREVQHARLAGHGAVLRDPVMVELVGLTPRAWCEHGISAQVKPKEVEDGAGYAGRISDQIFIAHEVRPDLVRERATRDGFHVFQPNYSKGMCVRATRVSCLIWGLSGLVRFQ
jgi:hypothetical protein